MDDFGLCVAFVAPCLCITSASENFSRLFGNTTESIRRLSFRDILRFHPESRLGENFDQIFHGHQKYFAEHFGGASLNRSVNDLQIYAFAMEKDCDDDGRTALVIVRRQSGAPGEKTVVLSEIAARIVEGVAMGESSTQIASRLNLSKQGVEYHISGLLRKFDAPSRTALISMIFVKRIFDPTCWPPKVLPQYVK
ncbi:LuxR C-terminal-related transcriptional regulator [Streptomyces sp. NPDC088554]|uniref:LuxR C-terminal-related transcriptional regulator n=1 Tax=Streptomyces sp. NPDC088554 TaxID=3365865 RepID=UPI00381EB711